MKSERGITLTILVIYIIIFSVVIGLLASLSSYIYGNIKYINDDSVDVSEFNKFNVYFIEDVKSNSQVQIDSQVNSEGKNIVRIVFGDGDIYSFVKEEKSIYKQSPWVYVFKIVVLSGINFFNFSFLGPSINKLINFSYGKFINSLISTNLASG